MAHQAERYPIDYWRPLLPQLDRLGLELDQRMQQAWEISASEFVTEVDLLTALLRLNTRGMDCLPETWLPVVEMLGKDITQFRGDSSPNAAEIAARFDFPFWMRTIELLGRGRTISCNHFLRAISETLLTPWQGPVANTPPIVRFLGTCCNERSEHEATGTFANVPRMLQDMPESRSVIEALGQVQPEPDDFQYALCIEKGEIVFRATSVLADFPMRASDGSIIGNRGLLTHLKERFGVFTPDEITELEDLIRNPKSIERDFQKFFESHPYFFRRWDYREVYPQVYLTRDDQGPLVPDFILTNPEIQEATIVELKLPKPKLIRRQENRDRFADAVMGARTQLLEYRDWFENRGNREKLIGRVKMEVFRPRLALVIGRSADFKCAIDRQKMAARTSDIDVVTYDDVVARARRRMVSIGCRAT
jgi:hypothetical protein